MEKSKLTSIFNGKTVDTNLNEICVYKHTRIRVVQDMTYYINTKKQPV